MKGDKKNEKKGRKKEKEEIQLVARKAQLPSNSALVNCSAVAIHARDTALPSVSSHMGGAAAHSSNRPAGSAVLPRRTEPRLAARLAARCSAVFVRHHRRVRRRVLRVLNPPA